MKTAEYTELNKAIEEAFKYGFKTRFVLDDNFIRSLYGNKEFPATEFAILKSIPVESSRGFKGAISYVVLDDGTLGFFLAAEENEMPERAVNAEEENLVFQNEYFLF